MLALVLALVVFPAQASRDLPMVVPASELVKVFATVKPLVIQAGLDASYCSGHIPGAFLAPHDAVIDTNAPDQHAMPSPDAVKRYLERLGGLDGRPIVLYGSPMETAWLFVALDRAGLGGRVSILDGGLPAWRAAGGTIETGEPAPKRGSVTIRPKPHVIIDTVSMRALQPGAGSALIDARSAREWNEQGHIAGAARVNWIDATAGGATWWKLPDRAALRKMFDEAGVKPGQQIVAYCAIGMRASVIYVAARLLGHDARLYDDSWVGWTAAKGPVAR